MSLAKFQWLEWVALNGKMVAVSLASSLVILFVGLFFFGRTGTATREYTRVAMAIENLADGAEGKNSLMQLEKPLQHHPELQAKFGAQIAQRFLTLNEAALAEPYAKAAYERIHDEAPYYAQFAETTLAISQGLHLKALEDSKKLKKAMEGDETFWEGQKKSVKYGSVLYAYNLLRIAFLEKEAGTNSGELLAWQELNNLLTNGLESHQLLKENFQLQDTSLSDYISYREKILQSKN